MKKRVSCTFALILLLPAMLLPASANASPTYWDGADGSVLAVLEDCPVTVSSERLTFTVESGGTPNVPVHVSAVYQMENPTDEALSVQMAFYVDTPAEGPYTKFDRDAVSVTAGGERLEYQVAAAGAKRGRSRIALVYAVDLPARGGREVAVSYRTSSSGTTRWLTHWAQTVGYLLSPAQDWAEFGTLDITVNTVEDYPYIVSSTLPLEADGDLRYTAHFDGLPDGELSFTLYAQPKITLWDRIYGTVTSYAFTTSILFIGLPLLLITLFVVSVVLLTGTIRKQRGGR